MGLKTFSISISDLSKDCYLRNDEKYYNFLTFSGWNIFKSNKINLVSLKNILSDDYTPFEYQDGKDYKGIPTGQTYLDEDGDISDFQPITTDNHPARLKYKISNNNILISSLRLAKSPALFFENEDLSSYVFSNGFYIFKVKKDWNIKYVLYILRTKKLKNILDNYIYRGIGISAYKKEDLLKIKVPIIPKFKQDQVVTKIEPIENKVKNLKSQIKSAQKIFNDVFSKEFKFNIEEINAIEAIKYFSTSNNITYRNLNLRTSVRWNKIKPIQKALYKNNPFIEKLGKYILSTKNGWSPNCKETDTKNYVFGVNSISKNGYVQFEDLKLSNESKSNISEYFAQENDLFVSRGNTVDLVALASIVKNIPEKTNYIYPDLFIKIELNTKRVSKEYIAFLFNSVIGRYYFKYSAKGKNQTMVKISSTELNNFYLPIPPLTQQQKIVDEIKAELNKQTKIRKKIKSEREKIDLIIEGAFN